MRLDDIQEDGIQIRQDIDPDSNITTFDTLTIRRLDVEDHQAGFGESGIEIQTNLASTLAVVIDDSDFALNTNAVIAVAMSKSATFTGHQKVTVQNSRFDASASFGNGSIQALGSIGSGTTTYLITGNTITNTQFNGITVNNDGGHTNATITNNDIDGSTAVGKVNNGRGISLRQDENGSMTVLISGNDMTQMTSDQIHLQGSDATIDDNVINLDATITNNTGTAAGPFGAGILVEVGDGSGIAKNDVRLNITGNNLDGTETTRVLRFRHHAATERTDRRQPARNAGERRRAHDCQQRHVGQQLCHRRPTRSPTMPEFRRPHLSPCWQQKAASREPKRSGESLRLASTSSLEMRAGLPASSLKSPFPNGSRRSNSTRSSPPRWRAGSLPADRRASRAAAQPAL